MPAAAGSASRGLAAAVVGGASVAAVALAAGFVLGRRRSQRLAEPTIASHGDDSGAGAHDPALQGRLRVAVAGGSGYVGSTVAALLLEQGHDVVVFDAMWFGDHVPPGCEKRTGNLFDYSTEDFAGVDVLLFLAGISNDPMADFSPAINFQHNTALPLHLSYVARAAGVKRVVIASSCSVYGLAHAGEAACTEAGAPLRTSHAYGISKVGCESVLQMASSTFSVICLRMGTVCGHGRRVRFDLVTNTMFRNAMCEGRITVNNPRISRPVLDIRDAAHGWACAAVCPLSVSGIFNLASTNSTIREIGEAVQRTVQEESARAGELPPREVELRVLDMPDVRDYRCNTEEARRVLRFRPRYTTADTVRSLWEHRAEYGAYDDEAYFNVRCFKRLVRQGVL